MEIIGALSLEAARNPDVMVNVSAMPLGTENIIETSIGTMAKRFISVTGPPLSGVQT